jgi:hypothetical protein
MKYMKYTYAYEYLVKNYYLPKTINSMHNDLMRPIYIGLSDPHLEIFEGRATNFKETHPSYKERLKICKKYKEEAIVKGVVPPDFDDTSCWFYPRKPLWIKITDSLFKK